MVVVVVVVVMAVIFMSLVTRTSWRARSPHLRMLGVCARCVLASFRWWHRPEIFGHRETPWSGSMALS